MSKISFLATIMLFSISAFSQNELSALYSNDQIKELKASNPEVLEYWNIYLNKGWVIDNAKMDQEVSSIIELGSIKLDPEAFNPLEYKVYPTDQTQYIGFSNSNEILIVYPKAHIIYHYNKSRK